MIPESQTESQAAQLERGRSPEVSVIVPARNEEDVLGACLRSLMGQSGARYEVIVVDDHSTDATREVAGRFPVRVISADPLPAGWSGKSNAAWSGARAARGSWLLFTDADTRHSKTSIVTGLQEAKSFGAALLSYSPRQEVHSFTERTLMPVVFAELARTFRPKDVCDPKSPVAAANGQYLLVRRDVYESVGGHAAVAQTILEDVELAKLIKQGGHRLRFRIGDVVSTRMYRSFPRMWEGWTKNLALLFLHPMRLALKRLVEFLLVVGGIAGAGVALALHQRWVALAALAIFVVAGTFFWRRIAQAHFDPRSSVFAILGLPLFAVLLVNSGISHSRGRVSWKGRTYGRTAHRA